MFAIDNNQAEIIHAQVLKSSKLINKNIEDADFPNGLRVGLIKKEDKIIIPEKDTKIEIYDEILFLCMRDDIKKAEELFQVRSEY